MLSKPLALAAVLSLALATPALAATQPAGHPRWHAHGRLHAWWRGRDFHRRGGEGSWRQRTQGNSQEGAADAQTNSPANGTTESNGTSAGQGATSGGPGPCGLPSTGKTLHLVATAYGPTLQDNYPYGPVDAFGVPLKPGDVAVDPSVIPLNTHLWVTGYHSPYLPAGGFCAVARDTGGAIKGNRIDLFINGTERQVSSFGIQDVTVTVLQ